MNTSKLFFIQNNKTVLGHAEPPRSIVFGFRNRAHAELVQQHVRYIPSIDHVDLVAKDRYLIKTHYNIENNIKPSSLSPRDLKVVSRNVYDASVICGINNLTLSIVVHIYERDDGDIELCCRTMKCGTLPGDSDVTKYNLEIIFNNSVS